ncbi:MULTISPECIES: hypothetical protein [unclassified Pseudofrankia]|uniref:hypothetical protein n=1 Tax=unclassified Pseudofrankia TaxID=2994372 RepID=UPI0012FF7F7E|nr:MULTISPECIES: hypothetical protein [unclassified Pseudofrankia]MDT3439755.1 hypothetical protein [Pseudofrankia sp. BMG5.37]
MTIALREAPSGGTTLTLVRERLDVLAAALPHVAAKVESGWADAVTKLAGILAGDAP